MTWITVKNAAKLLCVTERSVRKRIACNNLQYRFVDSVGGNSGRCYEVLIESLPPEAQDRFYGNQKAASGNAYDHMTALERQEVAEKHCIVMKYKEHKSIYPFSDKMISFLEKYNSENPYKTISKYQLNSWESKFDSFGIGGLLDRRGCGNKEESTVPDDVWNVFKYLWLKESRPSIQSCYEITIQYFSDRKLPHIASFKRRLDKMPEVVKIRYRDGKKAYEDKCLPYIQTDYSGMHSNQQWVADHHVFDVLVVDEKGDVFRPWLSAWIDRKSRSVMGYVINKCSPNSDIVLDSFARACWANGIPDGALLDNGKDYKVFDLFNSDFALSISNEMNIKVRNAIPYNAKAKPIERFFGTLEGKYCKHLPSYIGNDPKKRPEHMNKLNSKLKEIAMPYEDFKTFVSNMIKAYCNTVHSSLEGQTPQECYLNSFTQPKRIVSDEQVLKMFLMRTTKPVSVGRNGIRIPAIGAYFDDEKLYPLKGQRVFARYNSDDVRKVYVFDENDNFVCIANSVAMSEYDSPVTMETIRENNRKKKVLNRFIREQMPKIEEPTIERFVAAKVNDLPNVSAAGAITYIKPVKHKHAVAIRKEEKRQECKENLSSRPSSKTRTKREEDKLYFELLTQKRGA